MKMANRVSKSLKVVKDYLEEEKESPEQQQEDEYEARWRSHQQQMDQRERPWAPSPIRSGQRQQQFQQPMPNATPTYQYQRQQAHGPPPAIPRTPMNGSISGDRWSNPAPNGCSAKKRREEEYLMGYTGVPTLTIEDLERLGFSDPTESIDTIGPAHYLLMTAYEGNTYDGFTRGPKHHKLMQASTFEKLENTEARAVLQWYK
jgi:hypothetical protein